MTRLFVLTTLILTACRLPISASAAPHPPLVVLLLSGTSLSDWRSADAPRLHKIMATGSVALMNTRTARLPSDHRRETPESALLTLGAGSRAAGGSEITDFHPSPAPVPGLSVSAGALYARRTAWTPATKETVNIQWPRVLRENTGLGYDLLPGNLGEGLARHGITVTAGGRLAFPIACDSRGIVHSVALGARLPHSLPALLIWDAGSDTASADALIREAAAEVVTQRGRLMILSPFVNNRRYARGERLTPIVVWGPGVPPGLLYSPSTHRAGLVVNTDFAPSVTAFFGATAQRPWLPASAFGRPWECRPHADAIVTVARLESGAYRQERGMRILPFVALCLGLLLLAGLVRAWRNGSPAALCWLPGVIIFALLVSPSAAEAGLWTGLLSLLCWSLQARLGLPRLVTLLSASTVLLLAGDTLCGNGLMQRGLLGYSAVEGARYYGIGNEAMGPLVGAALVVAAALWKRPLSRQIAIAAALFALALLLGLPSAGAKAGGLLVAVAAFGTFVWTAWGKRWSARVVLALFIGMVLTLALTSLFDWHHQAGSQTHMGAAVARIHSGGTREALDIIQRKLAVEIRLLYHSAWAAPLWVSVIGLACQVRRLDRDTTGRARALLYGGGTAVAACLAVNDAGVVAAALCGTVVLSGLSALQTQKRPPPGSHAV